MAAIRAIETRYQGCRFRSRLEARWAVLFDAAGLAWEYEPEGYVLSDGTPYLPDFWLPGLGVWAEVKPRACTQDEVRRCAMLVAGTSKPCLLLVGMPMGRPYELLTSAFGAYHRHHDRWELPPGVGLCDAFLPTFGSGLFVCTTGVTRPAQELAWVATCVDRARSARFEHGEQG